MSSIGLSPEPNEKAPKETICHPGSIGGTWLPTTGRSDVFTPSPGPLGPCLASQGSGTSSVREQGHLRNGLGFGHVAPPHNILTSSLPSPQSSYPIWEDFNSKAAKLHSQLR